MYILGINISHDRSVCLLKDGVIAAAIAEERLDRDKMSYGFMLNTGERAMPMRSITYCLDSQKLSMDDLDLIVIDHALGPVSEDYYRKLIPIKEKAKIRALPHPSHHLAHACSAYYCSPFKESAVLVADGAGSKVAEGYEGESGFYMKQGEIRQIFKTYQVLDNRTSGHKLNYSLTYLYSFITNRLGFTMPYNYWPRGKWPDLAGKTMALAAYGKRNNSWPSIAGSRGNVINTDKLSRWVSGLKAKDPGEKLSQHHFDLAFKAQEELEKGLILLANRLYSATGSSNICIAGGAGLNCVANSKILENTPFNNIFIQPAATDDGNAIGCAMYGWHKIANRKKRFYMGNAYLGRTYSGKEIAACLKKCRIPLKPSSKSELIKRTARLIADGKIVGWFQGGSEFGPRGLGHRSILADARRAGMKDLLNTRVKRREDFRPYAPSVLLECADSYFDMPCPSPFMLLVAEVKKHKRDEIPAVIHVDGTARVQTVTKAENGIFYDLIKEFWRLTNVPVVLNTSFNTNGQPIVETPEEAIKVFLRTEMDVLVLGDYVLQKGKGRE